MGEGRREEEEGREERGEERRGGKRELKQEGKRGRSKERGFKPEVLCVYEI